MRPSSGSYVLYALSAFALIQFIILITDGRKLVLPTYIFDFTFLTIAATRLRKLGLRERKALFFFGIVAALLLVSSVIATNPFFDPPTMVWFLLKCKLIIYSLIVIFLLRNCQILFCPTRRSVACLLIVYIVNMACQYAYPTEVLRSLRPFVFLENNYEVTALMMLAHTTFKKPAVLYFTLVLVTQSISGVVAAVILLGWSNKRSILSGVHLAWGSVCALLVAMAISYRGLELLAVDRVQFWAMGIRAFMEQQFSNQIFGTLIPPAFPSDICSNLAYYNTFAFEHCFSVLFHAYWIRLFLETGAVFGVTFITFCIASLKRRDAVSSAILVICVFGLSLSGPLSGFIALTILLLGRGGNAEKQQEAQRAILSPSLEVFPETVRSQQNGVVRS